MSVVGVVDKSQGVTLRTTDCFEDMEEVVEEATGRDVTMSGALRLSIVA